MKTIIFDIDGTLTDMSPIENAAALGVAENCWPKPEKYPLVNWILKNKSKYHFVYATGGQKLETEYVLKNLGLIKYFDLENSVSKTNCRFSKKTGIPFRKIKAKFNDCIVIGDSENDKIGAKKAKIPFIFVSQHRNLTCLLAGV